MVYPKLHHLQVLNNRSLTITRLHMVTILMKEISRRDNVRSEQQKEMLNRIFKNSTQILGKENKGHWFKQE